MYLFPHISLTSGRIIHSRDDFVAYLDDSFSSLSPDDDFNHSNLKSYLIESNISIPPNIRDLTEWEPIGHRWYMCNNSKGDFIIADCSDVRVWILYTLMPVDEMDQIIKIWVGNNTGLDRCWLSRINFQALEKIFNLQERGVGLKFKNSISGEEDPFGFSLKARYGSGGNERIEQLFSELKDEFTTTSVRWRKLSGGTTCLRLECFNYGKITINYLENVEDTLSYISQISNLYRRALSDGEDARKSSRSAFEFNYTQKVNLEEYS